MSTPSHPVSASCKGEKCTVCGTDATHKVAEEIQLDEPTPIRHEYTAYVCCGCFRAIFGAAVGCKTL